PASPAWEAGVLPMNYICTTLILYHVFWKIQVYFLIFVKIYNNFYEFDPAVIRKSGGDPAGYGNFSWPELAKTI
uniref:hypothetical protein n=1 Tax=Enterocloster clostridioformis TaxID=1531 RepID=UPI00266F18F4